MVESRIRVGNTKDYLNTNEVPNTKGQWVHNEIVEVANLPFDGFGRMRVSQPVNLFLNKNVHNRNKILWEEPIVGAIIVHGTVTGGPFQVAEIITGGTSGQVGTVTAVAGDNLSITYNVNHNDFILTETITGGTSGATAAVTTVNTGSHVSHDRDRGGVILQVGAASGDQAVRTSHRYIPYVPGKSQLITLTFFFGAAVENVRRRAGYFDGLNGLYIEQTTECVSFVRRTNVSGTPDSSDSQAQANWSEDTLDGSGNENNPSGVLLDMSKVQFFFVDFVWQGVGQVRWGFEIDGVPVVCHIEGFGNVLTDAFMSTGSLPVRFEITNTGATAGTNTMEEICSSVVSEGGEKLTGQGFSASSKITPRSITTVAPVFAIRLKAAFGSDNGPNRKTVKFNSASILATGNNAQFEVSHVHDPASITATWISVGDDSAVEYSVDISAYTPSPEHVIEVGFAVAGQAGKGSVASQISPDEADQHRFLTQNVDSDNSEMFVIAATSFTGTAVISSGLSWVEFD